MRIPLLACPTGAIGFLLRDETWSAPRCSWSFNGVGSTFDSVDQLWQVLLEVDMPQFRYSLNSSTIRPTPILDKIRIAAQAGYEAIELWHDDIDLALSTGVTLRDIRNALADHRLVVPTTIMLRGWCEPEGPALQRGWSECHRRLEQAAVLGAVHSIAGPPLGRVDMGLAGQRYGELLELGIGMGVRPAMEYLGFAEQINTISAAREIMEAAGHTAATIVIDPFHNFRGGGGHEDMALLKEQQIAVCHFNDAPADPLPHVQRDADRVLPGQGVIPLGRFVSLLKQIGYARWISLELFREDLWAADPLQVAKDGLIAMRQVCEV